jgi:hypothetical protein
LVDDWLDVLSKDIVSVWWFVEENEEVDVFEQGEVDECMVVVMVSLLRGIPCVVEDGDREEGND